MKKIKRPAPSTAAATAAAAAAAPFNSNAAYDTHNSLRSPPLDLSTVPTCDGTLRSPSNDNTSNSTLNLPRRMFALEEAPTYTPTMEEFKNPLAYIEAIRPEAEKAGICKIIPPKGWKPKFSLDTEIFKFETRIQKLNSMEGETRANRNYLDQLYRWHRQAGHPVYRIPMLDKKPIDLFRLKKEVTERGGNEKVTEGKKWAEIGRVLKLDRKTCTSLSNSLKQAYMKICLPYEEFLDNQSRSTKAGKLPQQQEMEKRLFEFSEETKKEDAAIEQNAGNSAEKEDAAREEIAGNSAKKEDATNSSKKEDITELAKNDESMESAQRISASVVPEQTHAEATPSTTSGPESATPARTPKSAQKTPTTNVRRSSRTRKPVEQTPSSAFTSPIPPPTSTKNTPAHTPPDHRAASSSQRKRAVSPINIIAGGEPLMSPHREYKRMKSAVHENEDESDAPLADSCEVCKDGSNPEKLLQCDGCDKGFHTYCLNPPLLSVPISEWYCTKCLVQSGDDYGFEEGEIYSLHQFQKKANDFKRDWFAGLSGVVGVDEHGAALGGVQLERLVEREFWKLVESPHEPCEVEYGADLHSTVHGSGFPSIERHPTDPYSIDGWNLNIMPVLRESLFSHIKSDISGMMIPWLYVGMCFSTFCWHNEDHYTYSINYMHWGETKTWYGIPASDAEKFEDAMRAAVPELFENNPDLLFQLVTMLSPGRLLKSGTKVVALDQRPGQFVVTFPQSYHAGFNHGFNFAEAVNFAPAEWEPYGLACVQRYEKYRKMPVFSHDELLITAFQNDTSIETSTWLQSALRIRMENELALRRKVRDSNGRNVSSSSAEDSKDESAQKHILKEIVDAIERAGDRARCAHCHAYAYFSAVSCPCREGRVVCLQHEDELCKCAPREHFLLLRYTDGQLSNFVEQAHDRASAPQQWVDKLQKTISKPGKPSLKMLRSLLSEAENFPSPMNEVGSLKVGDDLSGSE